MKMRIERIVVASNNAMLDYWLPAYIAHGLYEAGEISQFEVGNGNTWRYADPQRRWYRYCVNAISPRYIKNS
jgi:hypothetical protein